MKNYSLTSALALAGLLTGPALAQDPAPKPAPSTALARIQSTFRAADTDKDKFISAVEAGRAGIPTRDFAAHDGDRDRRLSDSEFLLYYRFLLVKARRPVDKDIEAEVARIQAALRARQAEEAKKNQKPVPEADAAPKNVQDSGPSVVPARPADSTGPAPGRGRRETIDRLRRARASLNESSDVSSGTDASAAGAAERASAMRLKQRSAEMRAKLAREEEQRRKAADQGTPDPGAKAGTDAGDPAVDAAELERRAEAMRKKTRSEEMRAKLAQEEARKAGEAEKGKGGESSDAADAGTGAAVSADELARRSEAMRLKTRSAAARAKLAEEARTAGEPAPAPESAETRARRYSSRFVDAGLMTVQEGRDLAEALSSGRVAALDPAQRSGLLSSLTQARTRVDTNLAAGKIDSKEAESLKQLIDGHAKALAPAEKPESPDVKPDDAAPDRKRDATPQAKPERGGEPAVGEDDRKAPERPRRPASKGDGKGKKGDDAKGEGRKKGRG